MIVALALTAAAAAAEPSHPMAELEKSAALARVSLAAAIETARAKVAHGSVVEAALAADASSPQFEIYLLTHDAGMMVRIDAVSGGALGVEQEAPCDDDADVRASAIRALGMAKVSFAEAIAMAEKHVAGSRALSVAIDMEHGTAYYTTDLLHSGGLTQARIDAVHGKVIATADAHLPDTMTAFDEDDAGQAPGGWILGQTNPSKAMGVWKIVADKDAPSRPNVLGLVTANTGGTFNLATVAGSSYKNLDLRVDVRADTGEEDQGGGLIWRCKDENNYYICRINPLESNFRVYKVVAGRRKQLGSARVEAKAGLWYSLRAVMTGDRMRCYVDGEKLLDVSDDTFSGPGMVGLWTKADASSSFDNLAVYAQATDDDAIDVKQGQRTEKHDDENDDDDDD